MFGIRKGKILASPRRHRSQLPFCSYEYVGLGDEFHKKTPIARISDGLRYLASLRVARFRDVTVQAGDKVGIDKRLAFLRQQPQVLCEVQSLERLLFCRRWIQASYMIIHSGIHRNRMHFSGIMKRLPPPFGRDRLAAPLPQCTPEPGGLSLTWPFGPPSATDPVV